MTGGRTRYRGSKRQARLPERSARLRSRRANPFRSGRAPVPLSDQQSEEGGWAGRVWTRDGRASADSERSQPAQCEISRDEKSEAGPYALRRFAHERFVDLSSPLPCRTLVRRVHVTPAYNA